ncbi:hypothetical protein GCM10017687_18100 [Streptomyces echinatus]
MLLSAVNSIVVPPARTSVRSSGSPHRCRTPSAVSFDQPAPDRTGRSSCTRSSAHSPAASTKVTASRQATAGPPKAAYSAAPASGATSFVPSAAVIRSPLKSPRSRPGTAAVTRADSAASATTPTVPYRSRTVNSSHSPSGERTVKSVASAAASPRFRAMSRGLRRTRSAIVPSGGPAKVGAHAASMHRAGRLSDPVRSLTHTPTASDSEVVPNADTTTPVRYSPALRSRSTVREVVMAGHRVSKAGARGSGGCPVSGTGQGGGEKAP